MKDFLTFFYEKFSDLGKLSPEQLRKGQRLNPSDLDNFNRVDGRIFSKVVQKIMESDDLRKISNPSFYKSIRNNLTIYPLQDYQKMECYLGKNNSSGYCIKDGDELVSVFSSQESSGNALVQDAIKNGATRLDCFAEQDQNGRIKNDALYKLYSRNGFVIDEDMNSGNPGEPYSIQNGISYYVGEDGVVDVNNPTVVIFMKKI